MTKAKNLISAFAFTLALAPLAGATAFTYGATQDTAYLSTPASSHGLAENSKGRPGEVNHISAEAFAANSKGRPSEYNHISAEAVAANSKGRPAEFAPASSNQVAVNSKGRPAEFTPSNQVADNSKTHPSNHISAEAYG